MNVYLVMFMIPGRDQSVVIEIYSDERDAKLHVASISPFRQADFRIDTWRIK